MISVLIQNFNQISAVYSTNSKFIATPKITFNHVVSFIKIPLHKTKSFFPDRISIFEHNQFYITKSIKTTGNKSRCIKPSLFRDFQRIVKENVRGSGKLEQCRNRAARTVAPARGYPAINFPGFPGTRDLGKTVRCFPERFNFVEWP